MDGAGSELGQMRGIVSSLGLSAEISQPMVLFFEQLSDAHHKDIFMSFFRALQSKMPREHPELVANTEIYGTF